MSCRLLLPAGDSAAPILVLVIQRRILLRMAEQWIPTRKAFEIIGSEHALLERLGTGLLRARAELVTSEHGTAARTLVDPRFWQHDRYFDPHFDWHAGDFRNAIEGNEATINGVTVEVAGLLQMVPFEQRGMLARMLSVAGSSEWLTAQQAVQLVRTQSRSNLMVAPDLIIDQARLGFVVARAVLAQCQRQGELDDWTWQEREWDVPTWFWSNFVAAHSSAQDWSVGRFSGVGVAERTICSITLSDVHFHRASLHAFLGLTDEPSQPETTESKRGRRPTYDWASATSAIWGQLHRGDLQPQVQADVEKALIKLLGNADAEPSESTVRPFARTIFDDFKKD